MEVINKTFHQIQEEVKLLVNPRLEEMRQTPALASLILNPQGRRPAKETE